MDLMKKIQTLVRFICSFAIALMSTIVLLQVINRNIFGSSFKWVEELSGMCMIWITFLGAALATTLNAHTRIELFVNLLPKRLSKLVYALGDIVCAVFSLALSCYSYPLIVANIHTMSPAMKISLSFNYIVFCVATILICIFYLIRAKADFTEMKAAGKEDK